MFFSKRFGGSALCVWVATGTLGLSACGGATAPEPSDDGTAATAGVVAFDAFSVQPGSQHDGGIVDLSFDIESEGLASPRDDLKFYVVISGGDENVAEDLALGQIILRGLPGGSIPTEPLTRNFSLLETETVTYTSMDAANVQRTFQLPADLEVGSYRIDLLRDSIRYPTDLTLEVTEATRPDLVLTQVALSTHSFSLFEDGVNADIAAMRNGILTPELPEIAATVSVVNLGTTTDADAAVTLSATLNCGGSEYPLAIATKASRAGELYFSPSEATDDDAEFPGEADVLARSIFIGEEIQQDQEIGVRLHLELPEGAYEELGGYTEDRSCTVTATLGTDGIVEVNDLGNELSATTEFLVPMGDGSGHERGFGSGSWQTVYSGIADSLNGKDGGSRLWLQRNFSPQHLEYKLLNGGVPVGVNFASDAELSVNYDIFGTTGQFDIFSFDGSVYVDAEDTLGGNCTSKNVVSLSSKFLNNDIFQPIDTPTCQPFETSFSIFSKSLTMSYPLAGFSVMGYTFGLTLNLNGSIGLGGQGSLSIPSGSVLDAQLSIGPKGSLGTGVSLGAAVLAVTGTLELIDIGLLVSPTLHADLGGGESTFDLTVPLTLRSLNGNVVLTFDAWIYSHSWTLVQINGVSKQWDLYQTSTSGSL